MKKFLELGGVAAAIVLIAFGIGSIALGINGRSTVRSNLKAEGIVGTPDMTPSAIASESKQAGLVGVSLPSCSVAGKAVDTGSRARCFASYMRIHALEATGGKTYSQMPRFATADGKGTNDPKLSVMGPNGRPTDNALRNVWVTETALSTALNTSYMAEKLALFGMIVGIALLLLSLIHI